MLKIDLKHIYGRTRRMLTKPEAEWDTIAKEHSGLKETFRNYLAPVIALSTLSIFLLGFFHYSVMQTIGYGLINLISSGVGIWLAYLLTKEYLSNKRRHADNLALLLTVYPGAIFIVFHSLGIAMGNYFLGQLFTLLSFIFIRTLYIGIRRISNLPNNRQTNLLIIVALSVICIPVIISQVLMIAFGISAFNV